MEKDLLQGIDTIIVRVKDVNASKKWYQEKLELVAIWDDPSLKLVVLDTKGPTSLTLWQTDNEIAINKEIASYPIFRTSNASLLNEEFKIRGIEADEVIQDDHVKYFFFYDPDGNVLEACQAVE